MKRLSPLFLLLAVTASAQLRETIEVSIVNVDVLVTDRSGHPVTGLTANDFEIREDGKLQPITNFAEYTAAIRNTGASIETQQPEAAAPAPRAQRTIVLFVETSRLTPRQAKEMFDALRALLQQSVAPGDRVTIVTWDQAVSVRQQFTDDLRSIDTTLVALEKESIRGLRDVSAEVRATQAQNNADIDELASMQPGGTDAPPLPAANQLRNDNVPLQTGYAPMPPVQALEASMRQLEQIRHKTSALEALMESISAIEGRKIIIMAMRRFGIHAGAEYFGGFVPIDYRHQLDTTKLRDSLIRTANAHAITLYTVYPLGGITSPQFGDYESTPANDLARGSLESNVMMNETAALQDLADETGGLSACGSANIAELLPRVGSDLDAYYSLAYRSQATGKDSSRKIVVTTKNREYRVRARTQVVEKSDDTQMHDRVTANLYQSLPGSTIPFDVGLSKPKSAGKNRRTILLRLHLPIASLTTTQQGSRYTGEFAVYVVTGGVVGVLSEVERRAQPFHIPASDITKAKASFFTYDLELNIDPKVDRVSVGVMDNVGKDWGLRRVAIPVPQ